MQTTLYLPRKNKTFHMVMDPASDMIRITFGEIGKNQVTKSCPASEWDRIINEKKRNGYTEVFSGECPQEEMKYTISGENDVIRFLSTISGQIVKRNYRVNPYYMSGENIKKAENILTQLTEIKPLYAFNEKLYELFAVIPGIMSNPLLYTAKSERDFSSVLQREYDLLDNLKCYSADAQTVRLTKCGSEEQKKLLKMFDAATVSKIKEIYVFSDAEREKEFRKYCEENSITDHRLLFHGSRNENWWSIINTGLKINPVNVIVQGKMFGNGIYFADCADKSAGYTSLCGSRHASGKSLRGFIGIYDVALGNPFHITGWKSEYVQRAHRTV